MPRPGRLWLPVALGLALAGCAINALRVEEATSVATKGGVAVAAAREYLAKVGAAREALNLDYVALDPQCRPDNAYLRSPPRYDRAKAVRAQRPGWLCARGSIDTRGAPPGTVKLQLLPASEALAPALATLQGLSDYFVAITRIVAQDGPTTSADFTETVTLLNSAETLFRTATGSTADAVIPAADSAQVKPIAAFLKILDDMARQGAQVTALRALVAQGNDGGRLVDAARAILHSWEIARAADARARKDVAFFIMETAMAANPAMEAGARQSLVRDYYARAAAESDEAKLYPVLDATLAELAAADRDMRNALRDNPQLKARQRARLATLTRQRVTAALDALTAVLTTLMKV
jgi:hypothetical protein